MTTRKGLLPGVGVLDPTGSKVLHTPTAPDTVNCCAPYLEEIGLRRNSWLLSILLVASLYWNLSVAVLAAVECDLYSPEVDTTAGFQETTP